MWRLQLFDDVDLQQVVFYGCVDIGHSLSVTHVEEGASTEARVERGTVLEKQLVLQESWNVESE